LRISSVLLRSLYKYNSFLSSSKSKAAFAAAILAGLMAVEKINGRDLLIKYYPNPSRKWSVTNQMILDIYDKEVTNKSI